MEKFMETLSSKISTINDMIETLEDKRNPPPIERYTLSLFSNLKIYIVNVVSCIVNESVFQNYFLYHKGDSTCPSITG